MWIDRSFGVSSCAIQKIGPDGKPEKSSYDSGSKSKVLINIIRKALEGGKPNVQHSKEAK